MDLVSDNNMFFKINKKQSRSFTDSSLFKQFVVPKRSCAVVRFAFCQVAVVLGPPASSEWLGPGHNVTTRKG